jgi:hypothetical protein
MKANNNELGILTAFVFQDSVVPASPNRKAQQLDGMTD